MLDLTKFYTQNHFKFDNKIAYGIYRMRMISILPKGNYIKVTISFSKQLTREDGQKISIRMREFRLEHRALQRAIATNFYMELYIYNSATIQQEFFPVFEKSLDILDDLQIPTCETCPICGQSLPTNSNFIRIEDRVVQAHDICIEQVILTTKNIDNQMSSRAKKDGVKSLLISGIVGLIILGLMVLLSFLGAYDFVAFLSGYLCFTITRLVIFKTKKAYGKPQIIMNTVVSGVVFLLSIFLGSIFFGADLLKITYSEVISNYFGALKLENYALLKNMAFTFVFGILLYGLMAFRDIKNIYSKQNKVSKLS